MQGLAGAKSTGKWQTLSDRGNILQADLVAISETHHVLSVKQIVLHVLRQVPVGQVIFATQALAGLWGLLFLGPRFCVKILSTGLTVCVVVFLLPSCLVVLWIFWSFPYICLLALVRLSSNENNAFLLSQIVLLWLTFLV